MNPLIVSTGDALSSTQATSYARRSAASPVRYHVTSASSARAIAWRRARLGRVEMFDDGADLRIVAAADAIHLFDEAARALHEPRVERIALLESSEVLRA